MLLLAALVFSGALFSQAQKDREQKKPVDIKANVASRLPGSEENAIVMTGDVVFHHNGAVISCDSAVRYSDKRIDCFKNVIINKDSTFVYGDRAEYNGEINLARVYSPVVKVIDGDATLYTYNFTFNTLDNVGTYYGGGVMYQKDNVLESEKGYYYSDLKELVAIRNVEMKNDEYTVISDSVRYNMDTQVAHFFTKTHIWINETGEIITADRGRYNTQDSTYFFYGNAYILTDFRETWADSIDFNARREDALLYGNIQINDDENLSSAFGDFGQYWGERGETMLTKRPSLLNYNEEHNKNDTIYMRADTIFMFVIYPSDRPRRAAEPGVPDPHAHLKFADTLPDSVRTAIADSLVPVISRLRREADELRRQADSIMAALFPVQEDEPTIQAEESAGQEGDSLPDDAATPYPENGDRPVIEESAPELEAAPETEELSEGSRRRKDRNRGPNPGMWLYTDTVTALPPAAQGSAPAMPGPDSLSTAVQLPPTSMVTDTLSHMEKIRELLPSELSGQEASSLLEMIDGGVPESMSHLVADSIDVAALRDVIEGTVVSAGTEQTAEPEPEEPEDRVPPEVRALYTEAEELTARADSLKTAEAYIRPEPAELTPGSMARPDSLALAAAADSLARLDSEALADSISHLDKKALKKYLKEEKRKLKAEKKAEKLRLKEERRAAKAAKRAEKMAERQRKRDRKPGRTVPPLTDSLPAVDSLAMQDSLFVAQADSLETLPPHEEPAAKDDTVERIFRGWYDVKIWRKDMQAVCDSIVGFSRDSTIHMYTDPILWHAQSQIVSDSLILHTKGEEIDRAEFFGNPIMSSKIDEKQFNQVTGRTMTSWFRDNEVYRHDIFGNAEALYYIQEEDDPVPVALIVATASNITFLLEDQFVRYIIPREQVEWPVYPIEQIPVTQPTALKGFKWHENRQPSLEDVFDRSIRPTEREFHEAIEQPKFPIAARINRRREYLIENYMWADRVDPLPAHAVEFVISLQNE